MAGPVILENVRITNATLNQDKDGNVVSTSFNFQIVPGASGVTGSAALTVTGQGSFAIGSTYQLSLTAS